MPNDLDVLNRSVVDGVGYKENFTRIKFNWIYLLTLEWIK